MAAPTQKHWSGEAFKSGCREEETMTELEQEAEGLNETVLHLNLGFLFSFVFV
jgi:hypothetical protein